LPGLAGVEDGPQAPGIGGVEGRVALEKAKLARLAPAHPRCGDAAFATSDERLELLVVPARSTMRKITSPDRGRVRGWGAT